ncbi:Peptidase T2 asparaginase 2 [Trinorchestia longiramus]|nr:Peptidase T2 asparaginase 2 [Trinorchestia longiramus]
MEARATTGVVAVHGGAWDIPAELWEASVTGVKVAAVRGYTVVEGGGSAVDAVVAAVTSLEDDPVFDAGCGSVLTSSGTVEGCALIMEGSKLRTGAVAAVTNLQNPITVARRVMNNTPHVMLAGAGADRFAASEGITQCRVEDLITEEARRQLESYRKYRTAVSALFNGELESNGAQNSRGRPQQECQPEQHHDTVGCVVVDHRRHVACGTSTGGITNQLPGRVGDSPMAGCGGYADDDTGGVSTTGHGESIIKACLAHRIVCSLRAGSSPEEAGTEALDFMWTRVGGHGGAVIVNNMGDVAAPFTTTRMPWAFIKGGALHWGMHPGDHFVEALPSASTSV